MPDTHPGDKTPLVLSIAKRFPERCSSLLVALIEARFHRERCLTAVIGECLLLLIVTRVVLAIGSFKAFIIGRQAFEIPDTVVEIYCRASRDWFA